MEEAVEELGKALGIDLACNWQSIGSALLEFRADQWVACNAGAVAWPSLACTPEAVAAAIDAFAIEHGVGAVSLDGPQGWRDPASPSGFVGRQCERATRTPGKTGTYGVTLPRTWLRWVRFSIEVFEHLLQQGNATLANNPEDLRLRAPVVGKYHLLECFPTSTWRCSELSPLRGHYISPAEVDAYADALRVRYALPQCSVAGHHDNLQGVVAALPAVGLLGGPCVPIPKGDVARTLRASSNTPSHRAEGLIWDAQPRLSTSRSPTPQCEGRSTPPARSSGDEDVTDNPIVPDPRDPNTDDVIRRGVDLFTRLVDEANKGNPVGVGYGCFVKLVFGVSTFADVAGRNYAQADTSHVLQLARIITEAAGGRKRVTNGQVSIQAAMDTFVWPVAPGHKRPARAHEPGPYQTPYTREHWLALFPDGRRHLISECD